jgi:hypothetical protein
MSFPHGAVVAAHAARKKREQQDRIEEEEMTNYTTEDLEKNWEFKIVRSEMGAFRKPEVFHRLLQEESISGWELVEKLDDRRVRFKRRKEDRRKDAGLPQGIDPYRSQFGGGASRSLMAVLVGLAVMIALGAGLLVVLGGISGGGDTGGSIAWVLVANVGIVIVILVVMIGVIIARRR